MQDNLVAEEFSRITSVEFEIVEGLLLRKGAWTNDTLKGWKVKLRGDYSSIEKLINHYHLRQLFWYENGRLMGSFKEFIEIGELVKLKWQETLYKQFPDLRATVFFDAPRGEQTYLDDFNVTAFIER